MSHELNASAEEVWLPIPLFEGRYSVSSLGRVRSETRVELGRDGKRYSIKGGILKLTKTKQGYLDVRISLHGVMKRRPVHIFVLEAFVGPRPQGMYGLHSDGNSMNPAAHNLRWGTPTENAEDAKRHGTTCRGEKNASARLTREQVNAIRQDPRSQASIAMAYGVDPSNVSRIKTRDTWAHL